MAYRTRIYYSAAQKAEMWGRWQQGETGQMVMTTAGDGFAVVVFGACTLR